MHTERKVRKREKYETLSKKNTDIIQTEVLPKVLEKIEADGGFSIIPGPPSELFEEALLGKLSSFDRRSMPQRDRYTLAERVHFKRQKIEPLLLRLMQEDQKITDLQCNIRGNNYALPEHLFIFGNRRLYRFNFEEKFISLPKLFYGEEGLPAWLKEYSTIKDWDDSSVSWCLSSGLTNPKPIRIWTSLELDDTFWECVFLLMETAMALCSENWFYAIVEFLDRTEYVPESVIHNGISYPSKLTIVCKDVCTKFPVEIWGRIFLISVNRLKKYYEVFRGSKIKFILLACAELIVPHAPLAELIDYIGSSEFTSFSSGKGNDKVLERVEKISNLETKVSGKCTHTPLCKEYLAPGRTNRPAIVKVKEIKDGTSVIRNVNVFHVTRSRACVLQRMYGPWMLTKEIAYSLSKNLTEQQMRRFEKYCRPSDIERLRQMGNTVQVGIVGLREIEEWLHTSHKTFKKLNYVEQGNADLQSRKLIRRHTLSRELQDFFDKNDFGLTAEQKKVRFFLGQRT